MRVSVVIPTYSRSPLLCEAIDSVLAQEGVNLDVIVIDDGSTDDTKERVARYGSQVRYFRQENMGLGSARNRGLALAEGEFIALLDDDDWWMPGKLRFQVGLLQSLPHVSGTFSDFAVYRSEDTIIRNGIQKWHPDGRLWTGVFDTATTVGDVVTNASREYSETQLYIGSLYAASLDQYFVLPSTAVFRRSCIPKDGAFPPHDPICGDWDFFARMSRDAPLCYADHETAFNRSHDTPGRLTRTKMIRQLELRIDFLKRVYVADRSFYTDNKTAVDLVHKKRLAKLCKLLLLDGDRSQAKAVAADFRRCDGPSSFLDSVLVSASSIPGSTQILKAARILRHRL